MGGGKGAKESKSSKELGQMSRELFRMLKPMVGELTGQTMDVLMGGANAFSPSIMGEGAGGSKYGTPGADGGPRMYGRKDLEKIWGTYSDTGSLSDVDKIASLLPESFTGEQFRSLVTSSAFTNPTTTDKKGKTKTSKQALIGGAASQTALDAALRAFRDDGAGGVGGSTLPILSSAIEQSKLAQSRGLDQLQKQFGIQGMSSSPFAQTIMAKAKMQGDQATAAIPGALAEKFIFGMAPQLMGQQGLAFSGLANAGAMSQQGAGGPSGASLAGGALGGAASGALAGSVVPGWGTAVGAIGGLLGGLGNAR